jgi:hypothetical protein
MDFCEYIMAMKKRNKTTFTYPTLGETVGNDYPARIEQVVSPAPADSRQWDTLSEPDGLPNVWIGYFVNLMNYGSYRF